MEGSADQISLNSEAIYSGYQSVNYAKRVWVVFFRF